MKKIIVFLSIIFMSLFAGCLTDNINVQPTKSWENHYMSVEQFKEGTNGIKLDKHETIWVLSNTTLSRLLKDVKNGK